MHRLLLILIVFPFGLTQAQNSFSQRLFFSKTEKIVRYSIDKSDPGIFYLPARFANAPIDTAGLAHWRKQYNISEISLLYTSFKEELTFNQKQLNEQRVNHLLKVLPELNQNSASYIQLHIVEQSGCTQKESGNDFYHGFVLKGILKPTETSIRNEISFIKNYLKQNIPDLEIINSTDGIITDVVTEEITSAALRDPKKFRCPEFPGGNNPLRSYIERNKKQPNIMNEYLHQGYVEMRCYLTERGEIKTIEIEKTPGKWPWMENEAMRLVREMPVWEPAKYDGKAEANFIKISIYFGTTNMPTLVDCDKPKEAVIEKPNHNTIKIDQIVSQVLNRNKNWKNYAVVCDVTGSMSHYTADMMMWLYQAIQKDSNSVKAVTFFNDGDQKNDNKKKPGKTGGVYVSNDKKFSALVNLLETVMHNGSGGDIPENNLEAILLTIEKNPGLNEIIMIADNPAIPRDMMLLDQIKIPVRIILCASNGRITVDYLNIARRTKGSVHFNDLDVTDLHTLKEGEVFDILGNAFQLSGGTIVNAF